jgi:hypothetical protein
MNSAGSKKTFSSSPESRSLGSSGEKLGRIGPQQRDPEEEIALQKRAHAFYEYLETNATLKAKRRADMQKIWFKWDQENPQSPDEPRLLLSPILHFMSL